MNKNSRTKNSIVNLCFNIFYQAFIILMTFLSRRVFIECLNIDYLGISGLFSNLLQLLSLAELGISGAISFSMYKEIAEGNKKKLQALSSYYKKLYNRIAMIILIMGLSFFPFLKYLINMENEIPHIEIYYLIFLLDTVFSYLFIYKTTIVYADQNAYKLKKITIITDLIRYLSQIAALLVLKNYFIYLIIQITCTFLSNFIKSKMAEKWYPFIKEKEELPDEEKKELWKNIKAMVYYKFGGVLLNNTDNILISVLVGTTMVGIYSNYTMIYNKLVGIINLVFSSIQASIGNLNVKADSKKKYETYQLLNLISFWLFAIATIGIFYVAEDIIVAMTGSKNFILDKSILFVGAVNFYIQGGMTVNTMFRETTGIFKITKYSMLICTILNIIFSIIFGNKFGLFGILFATLFARLLTNVWYEPYLLYKKIFKKKPSTYYIELISRILLIIGIIVVLNPVVSLVTTSNLYLKILLKIILCFVLPNIILLIVFWKTTEFKYLLNRIHFIYHKIMDWMKGILKINKKI